MLKINYNRLPIKAHYFFLMAAMGPILPFLPVFGKQLGVSEIVMGGINGVLPIIFLIIKPFFGYLVDFFHKKRKVIFMLVLTTTSISYFLMVFIPNSVTVREIHCESIQPCNGTEIKTNNCIWSTRNTSKSVSVDLSSNCLASEPLNCFSSNEPGKLVCGQSSSGFYLGFSFWAFTILMSLGTIGYNVSNCISDAICFDVIGEGCEMDYGQQRVWGTIGFGISALLGGFVMDYFGFEDLNSVSIYFPAFSIATLCMIIDLICCSKLKLPPMPTSENILRDIGSLIKQPHIATFLTFAVFVGMCDACVIFYLLWYLEDLAVATNFSTNIKLLEGLTIAVETLCGEVVLFSVSGRILSKIGYGNCLSMCFAFYALRLALIAIIPSPWWIIPVEMFMQGPTYALCYTTIVAYASAVAPLGTSATIQGIVAGMDDGLGFSLGSIIGGVLYRMYGGKILFGLTSALALFCCIAHSILFKIFFKKSVQKPGAPSPMKTNGIKSEEGESGLETTKFILEENNCNS